MHRLIRIAALSGIGVIAVLWAAVWVVRGNPQAFAGTPLQTLAMMVGNNPSDTNATETRSLGGSVHLGGAFTLVDSTGKTVTDQNFRGKWMLVYFGYTYCPDICPTELQTMSAAITKLGPLAAQIVPIFITIDPERDTPEAIGSYVKLFDPRLVGLTGSTQQIADTARAYRVYYAKVIQKGQSSYLMDHSSLVYLIDPSGRFVALYNPQTDVDDMATELRNHLSQ
jgi:protein SCO1/2